MRQLPDDAPQPEIAMTIDRFVMGFAGAVVLTSLALGLYVSPNWYWLTAFVGANLLQSSFTGFCPLAVILKRVGVAPGAAF
jgi:Protein of unknown function (DUF2892)